MCIIAIRDFRSIPQASSVITYAVIITSCRISNYAVAGINGCIQYVITQIVLGQNIGACQNSVIQKFK
ncbi:hypothetical protein D3C75_1051690 [compost metagenome]